MSLTKEFCGKVRRFTLDYYKILFSVNAYQVHQPEFWKYYNTHKVSKNRAAQIVLNKYYSTTVIFDVALSHAMEFFKI